MLNMTHKDTELLKYFRVKTSLSVHLNFLKFSFDLDRLDIWFIFTVQLIYETYGATVKSALVKH